MAFLYERFLEHRLRAKAGKDDQRICNITQKSKCLRPRHTPAHSSRFKITGDPCLSSSEKKYLQDSRGDSQGILWGRPEPFSSLHKLQYLTMFRSNNRSLVPFCFLCQSCGFRCHVFWLTTYSSRNSHRHDFLYRKISDRKLNAFCFEVD